MKFIGDMLTDFIWVGDPHVQKNNLDESLSLIKWIADQANKRQCPVIFGGDQYNDFGIARVEVFTFWKQAFDMLNVSTISLVGNHDKNADDTLTFMEAHRDQTFIIDEPKIVGDILFMPFYRKNENFVADFTKFFNPNISYLICHQEFNGCQYENGFYSSAGLDPSEIWTVAPELKIISGHIHKEQIISKNGTPALYYLGTPRQLTRSDIGEQKGIFYINLAANVFEKIPTPSEVCTPFEYVEINESTDLSKLKIPESQRTYIDIKGSSTFIKKAIQKMPSFVKVRTFPTDNLAVSELSIKESDGISKAFLNYAIAYFNNNNLGTKESKVILSMIYDRCPLLKGGGSDGL